MSDYSIKNGVLTVKEGVNELPRDPWANNMLGKGYFQGNLEIEEAKLPSTLKSIGDWAFRECKNLKRIEIPNSVAKLEHLVFSECESLEEIVVPDSVSKMQTKNFEYCKNLKKVKLSKKIKEIPQGTFFGCESLEEIEYSDKLKSFERESFSGCKSLKELNISKDVTSISDSAFKGCSGLEKITVDEANECFNSPEGSNAIFEGKTLRLGCKNTVIPEGTTCIGGAAFSGCTSLKSITIPEGVTEIRRGAFEDCSNLEEIYLPSSLKEISDDCFNGCDKLKVICVDKKNKKINSGKKDKALVSDNKLIYFVGTSIPDDEEFEEIGENAINKPGITEFNIPEGVKKLDDIKFYTEESTLIDESGNKRLEVKEFPLKKLSIPSTLEEIVSDSINSYPQWEIEDIGEIKVSDNNKVYDSRNNCNAIICTEDNTLIIACKNTTIPEGVKCINGRLISKNGIKKLTIPKSVKQIIELGMMYTIDELVFLGEDVTIGYDMGNGWWSDPFKNKIQVKKICASKKIIEKLKKSYEYSDEMPEFIEQ